MKEQQIEKHGENRHQQEDGFYKPYRVNGQPSVVQQLNQCLRESGVSNKQL